MKRRVGIGVGLLIVVVVALVIWRTRGDSTNGTSASKPVAGEQRGGTASAKVGIAPKAKVDPRTQPKGSIAGTVKDPAGRPIANASVCLNLYSDELPPDFWEHPLCKPADASGAFVFADLYAASYTVTAGAPTYRFAEYRPEKDNRTKTQFKLKAGEHRKNVDIMLHPGGVEITGVVNDISGGPIAHARVYASTGRWGQGVTSPTVEADDKGAFTLWVPPGSIEVSASADGYAASSESGRAPGTFEILLTPEGSLSGTVVDARTDKPIEGANVAVERAMWDGEFTWKQRRTDAAGTFRIDGLSPGRFVAVVKGEKGYGRSEGSVLVGLGQHVTGVVVRVHPTLRVIGKVVVATSGEVCTDAGVWLRDEEHDRSASGDIEDDGTIVIHGLLPGTYKAYAWCQGKVGRDEYPPVVVADKDVTGVTWEVDDAAVVVGKITTKSGEPVTDAEIWARTVGGSARQKDNWNHARTELDGSYELRALKGGSYRLELSTERGVPERDGYTVEAKVGQTITKDIVLDDGGTLVGSVVDPAGKPVAGVTIRAQELAGVMMFRSGDAPIKSDARGAFTVTGLRAGDYRVLAMAGGWESLKKPGTTDDDKQGEKATIEAGKTTTVKLVVEGRDAMIKGVVLDPEGKPVPDAFLSTARESDAAGAGASSVHGTRGWGWGDDAKPVLTGVDGTFTIPQLAPGKYTLRAFRKGGGEAVLEHVATGTTNARLQIKHTGSIEGVAKAPSGPPPDELSISVEDLKTGYSREEKFFRTEGRFVLRDLPAGHFHVTASSGTSQEKVELDLGNGEAKTGVTIVLQALVNLTGRLVDHATKEPVPGIRVFAQTALGGSFSFSWSDDMSNTSDETGKFLVKRAPRTKLSVQGMAKDWKTADYGWFRIVRDISTTTESTIDLGDITMIKKRVKEGEPAGELGIHFKEQPPETPPDKAELRVSFIKPDGPAAKTELKVGDVIVTVDGIDVRGSNYGNAWTLMRAPPGTKLVLGLERGATVTITLAPPS